MWSLIVTLYNVKRSRLLYLRCLARRAFARFSTYTVYAHAALTRTRSLSSQGSLDPTRNANLFETEDAEGSDSVSEHRGAAAGALAIARTRSSLCLARLACTV
jgi:hypothetical protein